MVHPSGTSPFDLSGTVAIVTGGNGGIGLGMASGLVRAGASVVISGRDPDKLERAKTELCSETPGAKVHAVAADVTERSQVDVMVENTVATFGRVDVLVANAGINIRKAPQDYTPDEWHRIIETNLTAPFLCAQAVYPHMKRQGGGKIITIGSMASILGLPFAAPYASSKGGIVQLTRVLAVAWAKDNIQANAILPGWIDTDLTRGARRDIDGLHDRVTGRTPAGRWGEPADFGGIGVFLASRASDFVTGTAIPVDGGYSIMGG
ncbi:MAG: SDR family NAD(P)-dependent oxidoreductase [Hyphomicrobiaceae bacterium]